MTKTNPLAILAVLALLLAGCATPDAELVGRVKSHLAPMKPVYDHGADTFPGATPSDKAIYRRYWESLDKLLTAATQPAVTK